MNYDLKVIFLALTFLISLSACDDSSGGRRESGVISGGKLPDDGETPNTPPEVKLVFQSLSSTILYTSDTADESCLDFSVKVSDLNNVGMAEVPVTIRIAALGEVADKGKLQPAQGETDTEGVFAGKYCAGADEWTGSLTAEAYEIIATSAEFSVIRQGSFSLSFTESSIPTVADEEGGEAIIPLNLFNSGPNDCTTLYYTLEMNGLPLAGHEVEFFSQPDFPKGVKLAKRDAEGSVVTDPITNRKSAYYKATSSSEGRLAVPVCAGSTLGTLLITGRVADEEGKIIFAHSPVISIKGGLPNHLNFSLTFDKDNARTLKGYFNTNSPFKIRTEIKVGSRHDGDPILDNQVSVAAETGKIEILNGGRINPETGTASFTLNPLHMINYYAYHLHSFPGYNDARTRCHPIAIAASLNPAESFHFSDLADNWRSTVVYMVRGQEYYFDRNGNGEWDGGDGFWDKNQNGVFDQDIDVLTYDHNNNGQFDYDGEWFIDLPSPFIDVNENNVYDAEIDISLNDEGFQAANGKWDRDTIIWKYEYYPIYMGSSPYAMARYRIHPDYLEYEATPYLTDLWAGSYAESSRSFGAENEINEDILWAPGATDEVLATTGIYQGHVFAHGICGNPLPGGSRIEITPVLIATGGYGDRAISNHIYTQPSDELIEPSRRILKLADGSNSTTINFNAVDHPYREYGYPITFRTRISNCSNECTGDIATPGVACGANIWELFVSFIEPENSGGEVNTISKIVSHPAVKTCSCVNGASFSKGVCSCPDKTESDGVNCVLTGP